MCAFVDVTGGIKCCCVPANNNQLQLYNLEYVPDYLRVIPPADRENIMLQPETQYTKLRWFFTIFGLSLYVLDIVTDVQLVVKYFMEGEFLWMGLTLGFILAGVLVRQSFSYAWYGDDLKEGVLDAEEKRAAKWELVLHIFGVGIFMRYTQ